MKPELKSDALDLDIAKYVKADYSRRKLINLSLFIVVILNVFTLIGMIKLAVDTRDAIRVQIPGLKQQIGVRDKTIRDQQSILEDQAIPAIIKLSNQVKSLGGEPGEVVLSPPKD